MTNRPQMQAHSIGRGWAVAFAICIAAAAGGLGAYHALRSSGTGLLVSPVGRTGGLGGLDGQVRGVLDSRASVTPAALAADPLGAAGLEAIGRDPGDIGPPPGAVRRLALKRDLAGQVRFEASYVWSGELTAAAQHYLRVLKSRQYELLNDKSVQDTQRIIIWADREDRVVVSLRKQTRQAKMDSVVNIVLTVLSPQR